MSLIRATFRAMASEHEIQIAGANAHDAQRAADAAIADVLRIEHKYTRYRDDSLTSRINGHAGGVAVAIDDETAALLRYADACHAMSAGRFDLTSGVLRQVWNFRAATPTLPAAHDLARVRKLIDWPAVEWDAHTIRLPRVGMEIDFGGIGKEYAADRAATILQEHGIRHALVNLGGDVRAIGAQADGMPWRVGVAHPRAQGAAIAGIAIDDGALATSGDYERFVEIDGQRYCHILDATTGMPVTHWQSVSVVAPLCVLAGSYATIAMLLQADAPAFLEAQGVRWLGVGSDGSVVNNLALP
ncbi:MAG: FAD:protein FMN transferase [Betaproteobacteria bacterium]